MGWLSRIEGRMVVNGDLTQIDLPEGKKSGLLHASEVLAGVPGIAIAKLTHKDVVRHELVMNIIKAYNEYNRMARSKTLWMKK